MKKHYLLLSAAVLLAGSAHAQGTELFFSEYNEGAHQTGMNYGGTANSTGSEKAVEVFNPTVNTVNLNAYSIRRYSNGAVLGSPLMEEERLIRTTGANTLARQSTFVITNPDATLPDILRASNMRSAARAVATAPGVLQVGGTVWFNGDDAMALVRYPSGTAGQPNLAAGVIIDIIGSIGERPTTNGGAWSSTNPLDGTPPVYVSSANQSIIRRASVSTGTRANPLPQNVPGSNPPTRNPGGYDISAEWRMYSTAFNGPMGTSNPGGQLYDRLGEHSDYTGPFGIYGPLATLEKFNNGISLYPNPATGTATVELKDVNVGSIVVINNLGQRIEAQPVAGAQRVTLNIAGLKAGLYFVQFVSADGQSKIYKTLQVQ